MTPLALPLGRRMQRVEALLAEMEVGEVAFQAACSVTANE